MIWRLLSGDGLPADYEISWPGLLRIAAWTVLFLWVFSLIIPENTWVRNMSNLEANRVAPMMDDGSDWVYPEPAQFTAIPGLNVVWIAGSGSEIVGTGDAFEFVPEYVSRYLQQAGGLDWRFWFYMIKGARTLDTYTAQRDAVLRKPDLIVIEVNPAWAFSGIDLYRNNSLPTVGSGLWSWRDDLAIQAAFTGFGDILANRIGQRIPALPESFGPDLGRRINAALRRPAAPNRGRGVDNKIDAGGMISSTSFWIHNRLSDATLASYGLSDSIGPDNYQAAVMVLADPSASVWGNYLLDKQFQLAAHSGIPTLFYLAPLDMNRDLHPDITGAYSKVQDALQAYSDAYDSETIKVVYEYPADVAETFRQQLDYSHLTDPGLLPDYLGRSIIELSKERKVNAPK